MENDIIIHEFKPNIKFQNSNADDINVTYNEWYLSQILSNKHNIDTSYMNHETHTSYDNFGICMKSLLIIS